MCGYSRYIGESTAFIAEIWGIFDGLSIAQQRGCQQVELQIDSQVVVSCLTKYEDRHNMCSLVRNIRNIMQEDWRVVVKHVTVRRQQLFMVWPLWH
jgi:ribonuclease HI